MARESRKGATAMSTVARRSDVGDILKGKVLSREFVLNFPVGCGRMTLGQAVLDSDDKCIMRGCFYNWTSAPKHIMLGLPATYMQGLVQGCGWQAQQQQEGCTGRAGRGRERERLLGLRGGGGGHKTKPKWPMNSEVWKGAEYEGEWV